jgi:hypothetical protein
MENKIGFTASAEMDFTYAASIATRLTKIWRENDKRFFWTISISRLMIHDRYLDLRRHVGIIGKI